MNFDSRELTRETGVSHESASVEYAGFLLRFVATFVDGIVFAIPATVIIAALIAVSVFVSSASSNSSSGSAGSGVTGCLICLMYPAVFIGVLLYNAIFESSKYMATPGKMLVGIKVTDLDGNRLSFGKAMLRVLCKYILNMFLYAGSLFILISDKKQGLYDVIAGTLVVKRD